MAVANDKLETDGDAATSIQKTEPKMKRCAKSDRLTQNPRFCDTFLFMRDFDTWVKLCDSHF